MNKGLQRVTTISQQDAFGDLKDNSDEKPKLENTFTLSIYDNLTSECSFDWEHVADLVELDQRIEHMKHHIFGKEEIIFTITPNLYQMSCQDEARLLCGRLVSKTGTSSIALLNPSFIKRILYHQKVNEIKSNYFDVHGRFPTMDSIQKRKSTLNIPETYHGSQKHSLTETSTWLKEEDLRETEIEEETEPENEISEPDVTTTTDLTFSICAYAPQTPEPTTCRKCSSIDFCALIGSDPSDPLGNNIEEMYAQSELLIKYDSACPETLYKIERIVDSSSENEKEKSKNETEISENEKEKSKNETEISENEKANAAAEIKDGPESETIIETEYNAIIEDSYDTHS